MDFKDQYLTVETKADFEKERWQGYVWTKESQARNKRHLDSDIARLRDQIKQLQAQKKAILPVLSFKKYCQEHTYEKRVRSCRAAAIRDGFAGFHENDDSKEVSA